MVENQIIVYKQPQIGKVIKDLRAEMGLTQEELAAELGVVCPTVNRWENGRAQPSRLAIKSIQDQIIALGEKGQEIINRHSS